MMVLKDSSDFRQHLLQELQMITGDITDDLEYQIYLILKENKESVKEEEEEFTEYKVAYNGVVVEDVSSWFNSIKEKS